VSAYALDHPLALWAKHSLTPPRATSPIDAEPVTPRVSARSRSNRRRRRPTSSPWRHWPHLGHRQQVDAARPTGMRAASAMVRSRLIRISIHHLPLHGRRPARIGGAPSEKTEHDREQLGLVEKDRIVPLVGHDLRDETRAPGPALRAVARWTRETRWETASPSVNETTKKPRSACP